MPLHSRTTVDGTLTIVWSFSVTRSDVWDCLTSVARMGEWLGHPSVFELRPAGELVVDHGDGYLCSSQVTEFEDHRRLALTWGFPDEHRTAVAFSLQDDPTAGSAVVLRHQHLGPLMDSYRTGWLTHLTFFEASLLGAPIPTSQFWKINATFHLLGSPAASSPGEYCRHDPHRRSARPATGS